MNRSKHVPVLALLAALAPLGCQRVIDALKGLAGGSPAPAADAAPAANGETPTTPTDAPPSSVRTRAPSRATGCPALTDNAALLPGTEHGGEVRGNETWTLEDSPHRLPEGVDVSSGATLTIAPCAVVLVGNNNQIRVMDGGGLVAVGDAQHPVRFGSNNPQPQPGDWSRVLFSAGARAASRVSHVIVEHGGSAAYTADASDCFSVAMRGLHVDHLTARHCKGFGLGLYEGGSFSIDSGDVTVAEIAAGATRSGSVFVQRAPSVASIPPGRYTGNAGDEVFIAEANSDDEHAIRQTATWKNLGVPYHLNDDADLRVEGASGPVLTVAAGVTLRMGRNARVVVGALAEGGLVMDGNAEETRVVLRPAGTDESPGQWVGVQFGARFNRTASRLRFVTLRGAGAEGDGDVCDWAGETSDRAFLRFDAEPQPANFEHLTFAAGAPNMAAVARNWRSATVVDFAAAATTNDFAQWGTGCKQSPLRNANGDCPETPPACQ